MSERIVSPAPAPEDGDTSLRPRRLAEFIGQAQLRANLSVFIEAAGTRGDALDHVLFAGPPGLGKTTLAQIVAAELGVGFRLTSGPIIARAGDLAAILTNLQPRDVLFIDEIHRLQPTVEEILYPAMEDYKLDLMIGEGPAARSIRLDLPPFTLVGATTRTGLLTTPLRDRFGIVARLEFYEVAELEAIVLRGARLLGLELTPEGAREIARRARGTPRVATRLLRRVRDFATVEATGKPVDAVLADRTLRQLEVDDLGLDSMDRRYLRAIAVQLWRRAGRDRHDRGGAVGAARHARGDGRAVPAPAGAAAAHTARAVADPQRLAASRPERARTRDGGRRPVRGRAVTGAHELGSASITRTPTPPGSSTTRATSASRSAGGRSSCAGSASISVCSPVITASCSRSPAASWTSCAPPGSTTCWSCVRGCRP